MSVQACSHPRSLTAWAFAAILALATSTASAAILHDQPPVGGGNGYYANINWPQQLADDFTLGGAVTLQGITWWGGYDAVNGTGYQGDDAFLVRLYSGIAGTGTVHQDFGSVSFSRSPTSLLDVVGNEVYQYDFALSDGLSAGAYYLFVQNTGTSDWFWLKGSSGNRNLWFRSDDADTWSSHQDDLAFRIEGTPVQVPEPSSLALLGIAGLSLVLVGWRVRQRQAA